MSAASARRWVVWGACALSCSALAVDKQVKVVYHLSDGLAQVSDGILNIRNQLVVDPTAKIVVVAYGKAMDFLFEGAVDKHKNPFNVIVEDLTSQGVEFVACENTLKTRKLDRSKLLPEVRVVPAGVEEIARLQSVEGYAYIRP